jgi:hypothetical protein
MADLKQSDSSGTGTTPDDERKRYVDAVVQMTKLTQEGKIRWESLPKQSGRVNVGPTLLGPPDELEFYDESFRSIYKGTHFILTRTATRARNALNPFRTRSRTGWEVLYKLEIVDENEVTLFTFPAVEALRGLHSSIQDQLSNMDEVISKLFEE